MYLRRVGAFSRDRGPRLPVALDSAPWEMLKNPLQRCPSSLEGDLSERPRRFALFGFLQGCRFRSVRATHGKAEFLSLSGGRLGVSMLVARRYL